MASVWDAQLRLEAWQRRRAVVRAGALHAAVRPDALIVCPLAMAGEDPSLHAVAVGRIGAPMKLLCAPDPRAPRHQLELYARLHRELEPHVRAAMSLDGETAFPQLIVPSGSAAAILGGLAGRLPWLPEPDGDGARDARRHHADAVALGRILVHYAKRWPVEGQQSVLSASALLAEHWAFGMELTDHLGAMLLWIDPPTGEDLLQAAAAEEHRPMGAKTDAAMDAASLDPALVQFAKVDRGGASGLRSFRRKEIEDLLRGVLAPVYDGVQDAVAAVNGLGLAPLDGLADLCERERDSLAQHLAHIDSGGNLSKRDTAKAAVFALAEREDAVEQWVAAKLWGDPLERARARFEGDILHGACQPAGDGLTFTVESSQRWLRCRRGDELHWMGCPDSRCAVNGLARSGHLTLVSVTFRPDAARLPAAGQAADFAKAAPNWKRIWFERGKIKRTLRDMPVTHQSESEEARAPAAPQWTAGTDDPAAAVEALR